MATPTSSASSADPAYHREVAKLVELAHDRSSDNQRHLVDSIADLYLADDRRLSDEERSVMGDLLGRLVGKLERDIRKNLAERLSDEDEVSRDLMVQLANDDFEVAAPILMRSRVLEDPDLVEIVRHRGKDHKLAIAGRDGVGAEVSDALAMSGDEDVIAALLDNPSSAIAEATYEYLIAQSETVDRFQEPLLNRDDLPPKLAHRMFWWVSAALRRHILANYSMKESDLDEALEAATEKALGTASVDENAPPRNKAEKLVDRLASQGQLSPNAVVSFLRQRQVPLFIAGLAKLANVNRRVAMRIAHDQAGEGLAVACKAIGMERGQFVTIHLLLAEARNPGPRPAGHLEQISNLFDGISLEAARRSLRYWHADSALAKAVRDLDGSDDQGPNPAFA